MSASQDRSPTLDYTALCGVSVVSVERTGNGLELTGKPFHYAWWITVVAGVVMLGLIGLLLLTILYFIQVANYGGSVTHYFKPVMLS